MANSNIDWMEWQKEVLASEDYAEIIKRIRDKAQRSFDVTVKESLVKVEVKK